MHIDTTFDFRSDSAGRDPDRHSPTLKNYHQVLWSKPLPNGDTFSLETAPGHYLRGSSKMGTVDLSSDTISNSFRSQKRLAWLIAQIPESELDAFQAMGSTIGARILFPGNRVEGSLTINVARGFVRETNDRMDLTLECIRLQYQNHPNPLGKVLAAYGGFFQLFESFQGFVEFFLLQDLVEREHVRFFLPFGQSFSTEPLPQTPEEYRAYANATMSFVSARNERINQWAAANK